MRDLVRAVMVFCVLCSSINCASNESEEGLRGLSSIETWMYQIQGLDEDGAIEALAASDYPMLVLEPGQNFIEYPYDTEAMVEALRERPSGERRILLAYIDIGQAEDYRDYWGANWVAPTAEMGGEPDYLVTIDPDGWTGNYPVAYWDSRWQQLWVGPDGIVGQLRQMGFDGIYLDWVEAYDDEEVMQVAAQAGLDPAEEMIDFIEALGQAGDRDEGGFYVVPQNAPYLLDADPDRYATLIDALAVEDTWYHGDGDAEWDDPRAGDLRERHDGDWSTEARLAQYNKYLARDLPVFTVDYCIKESNAAEVYSTSRSHGFVPLVTRVSLGRMTQTPP